MKRCIFLILCGLIIVSVGNKGKAIQNDYSDIEKLFLILERYEDLKIEEWIVTTREVMHISTEAQFLSEVNQLKKTLPGFTWKTVQHSTNLSVVGVKDNSMYRETVTLASTFSKHADSYITYEITGRQIYDKMLQDVTNRLQTIEKALFQENPTIFTCVKGVFNDTIDKVLNTKSNSLMKDFQAVEVESLKEENFISITASSSFFKQSNVSDYYNLQLAMRNDGMGANTSFVIGTPIITFEY